VSAVPKASSKPLLGIHLTSDGTLASGCQKRSLAMNFLKRFNAIVLPSALVLGMVAHAQQQGPPPPPPPPDGATAPPSEPPPPPPPLTKDQMKDQRNAQKHDEKAAKEKAKADKADAKALKHQDKAADESEKAAQPPQ
jgi:hypothetical protein